MTIYTSRSRAETLDSTSPHGGPTGEAAFMLEEKLGENASFTQLRKNSKKAARSGVRRQRTITLGSNYGVYPENNLLILDVDVKGTTTPEQARQRRDEQLDVLSAFFHVPLRETFSVITPTGGVHNYVLLPAGFTFAEDAPFFPKSSFNGAVSAMVNRIVAAQDESHRRRKLTVDIRRPDVSTYVLGPGSWLADFHEEGSPGKYLYAFEDHGFSEAAFDAPILDIPAAGIENLRMLSQVIEERNVERMLKKQREAMHEHGGESAVHHYPSTRQVQSLRRIVKRYERYHQKRAAAKSALACCYTDEVITDVCIELGIHRDSSRKTPLTREQTLKDLTRFQVSEPQHSAYCHHTASKIQQQRTTDEGEPLSREQTQERLAQQSRAIIQRKQNFPDNDEPRRYVNPAVVDMVVVRDVLMSTTNRKTMPNRVKDALDIVDYYVQPLTNFGVGQIILSRAEVQQQLSLSESRVTAAMRLLRETEVLHIDIPPQPGRTTVYTVNTNMFNSDLSWALKKHWGYNNARRKTFGLVHPAALYYDRALPGFREVFTGEQVVSPNPSAESIVKKIALLDDHPVREHTGPGAALRYIRTEAREHDVEVVSQGTGRVVIDKSSGEVLVDDWNTPNEVYRMSKADYKSMTGYISPSEHRRQQEYAVMLASATEQREFQEAQEWSDRERAITAARLASRTGEDMTAEDALSTSDNIQARQASQSDVSEVIDAQHTGEQYQTESGAVQESKAHHRKKPYRDPELLSVDLPEPPPDAEQHVWDAYYRTKQRIERENVRRLSHAQQRSMSYHDMMKALS